MRVIIVTLFFLLLAPGAVPHEGSVRPVIELARVDFWTDMHTFSLADLDGDGTDEIIRLFSDHRTFQANRISRTRLLSPAMYQGNSVHRIESITPIDIDSFPGHELAVVKHDSEGDSLWIEIICGYNKELRLCTTRAVAGKNLSDRGDHAGLGWDGAVYSCHAVDLDDDGVKEIIVPVVVGFDLYPRGLYVFSYPSGELRWRFLTAGNPDQPWFADANNDGFMEVYVKTCAVSNGAVVGDRDDNTSYLFCLDHLGYPIWRQTMGDRFDMGTGNVHICDCDGDETTEIYYIDLVRQDDYDRQVRILEKHRAIDNVFLSQRSFDADQVFSRISTADTDNDSLREIIVDGFIGIMKSTDLRPIRMGGFEGTAIGAIENLDGDANDIPEIVLLRKDSLYIVGRELNILGAARADEGYQYFGVRRFTNPMGQQYLAAIMTTKTPESPRIVNIYEIRTGQGNGFAVAPSSGASWWLAAVTLLIGLGIGIAGGLTFRRRRTRRIREPRAAQYENLLTSLANFDHGRMGGKNLNRLQFLFANLPDSPEKLEQIRPNIMAAVEGYHAYTVSQLNKVAQYGRKLKSILPFVSELMKHKERLTDLLTREMIFDLKAGDEAGPAITDSIESLQVAIRQVRKTVQSYFSTDLLRVVPGVLIAIVSDLRRNKVGFRTIETRGGALRLVFFDETELASIFEELLSNACDAMADSDEKELSMLIDFGVDEVVIRVTDSGSGLKGADPEQLFRRDFSTKSERGGYGLYHARQQVERFGGQIRIFDNENGRGATVELILKTVNHE